MKKIILGLVLFTLVMFPLVASAQDTLVPIVKKLSTWLLSLLSAFAALMIVVAGFTFVTAQGDPEKVKTARNFVLWALVGVLVGGLAWILVQFVVNFVLSS